MRVSRHFLIHIFIVGFWVLMMVLLLVREFVPKNIPLQNVRFPEKLPYKRDWGIYSDSERAGGILSELTLFPAGYLWKNEAELEFFKYNIIKIKSNIIFNENKELDNFAIDINYDDIDINLKGTVKNKSLEILLKSGRELNKYEIPWLKDADVMGNGIFPLVYLPGIKAGERFKWYVLNPLTRTKGLVKAIVKRSSFYFLKNDFVPVFIVDVYFQDMKTEFWIDEKGEPLKVVTPWGWEVRAE